MSLVHFSLWSFFLILYFHLMFTPFFFLLSRNIPYNHSCHTFWFIWRHYRKFSCFRDLSCNHILINKLLSKRRRNNRVLNCIWSALGYPKLSAHLVSCFLKRFILVVSTHRAALHVYFSIFRSKSSSPPPLPPPIVFS